MAGPAAHGEGGWTPVRSAAGRHSIWLIASIVSLATFMEVLDISIANVALNHIAGGLSASYDEATWVLTSYLIANAIAVPISGWLSNVIGRKRFYMLSVALFTVASFFCGIAPNLTFLIAARIAQGIGGGGLAPSEQSILTETFPPSKRGGAFALYGLTVIAAPIIGPTVGGIITDTIGWHWIFLINLPVGVLSLWLVHTFVVDPPKLEEERRARFKGGLRVDYAGIVLLVLWLGCMEFVLDRGQRELWLQSPLIKAFLITSVVSCIALWIWEWDHEQPVFDVRLLARPSYAIAILVMLVTGAVVLGTTQLIPQFLQQVLGYTASNAGKALTLGGIVTVAVLPLVGRLTGKMQPKYLMVFGLASESLALFLFTNLDADVSWWWAATTRATLAIGIPFLFIPINTAAYAGIPGEKTAEASSQINLARNLGGSIAISIAQAVIEQRSQFHQSRLVETLSPGAPNYQHWLRSVQDAFSGQGAAAGAQASAQIYQAVTQQAAVLAYADTFWLLAIAVACVTPLILFMKKVDPNATPA